ncbi:MAG TPA: isochorismate synthase [Kiloniellaceae bacterium]|nr:isochorismate synthase [Kiloniellaceae bacterium]
MPEHSGLLSAMTAHPPPLQYVDELIHHHVRDIEIPATSEVISLTLPLPDLRLHGLPQLDENWTYWAHPEQEHYLLGLGSAWENPLEGIGRFRALYRIWREKGAAWHRLDPENSGALPLFFCAYAFDPDDPMKGRWSGLPNSLLCLPELLLERRGNDYHITFSAHTQRSDLALIEARWRELMERLVTALAQGPSRAGRRTPLIRVRQEPTAQEWLELVKRAIRDIDTGRLEKVVPARCIEVQAARRLDPSRLMAVLDCLYPTARLFGMGRAGKSVVAATPERQILLQDSEVTCDAIGGTIHRAAGEAEDRVLGEQLLNSPKMRREHAFVIEAIVGQLKPCCEEIHTPPSPALLPLRNLQHLWTEIHGRTKRDVHLFDLIERLHPTPAVNGSPTRTAFEWLQQEEPLQRGWFSGAGGWIDAEGNGELAVLLRCALLQGENALLYAGAGVVADSSAEEELAETELKFTTMLEALENA